METFPNGSRSVLARTVAAEIRARIGADRSLTGQKIALGIGRSQNYVAERLRDEKPFTLDDVEAIARYFDDEPGEFVQQAFEAHLDLVYNALQEARWAAAEDDEARVALVQEDFALGARDEDRQKPTIGND